MDEIISATINMINSELIKAKSSNYVFNNNYSRFVLDETDKYKIQAANIGDIVKVIDSDRWYCLIDPGSIDNESGWVLICDHDIPKNVKDYIKFLEYLKTNINQIYRLYEYTKGK